MAERSPCTPARLQHIVKVAVMSVFSHICRPGCYRTHYTIYVLKVEKVTHTHTHIMVYESLRQGDCVGSQPSSPVNLPSFALLVKVTLNEIRRHTGERRSQEVSTCLIQTSCSCGVDSAYLMVSLCACMQISSQPTTQSKVTHTGGDQQLKTRDSASD